MEDLKIGIAEIVYSESGEVLRAFFTPTMILQGVESQLLKLPKGGSPTIIKKNAETLLATWFNKQNEIELADREDYVITSEILKCEYYQDESTVRRCKIEFTFRQRSIA